MVKNKRKIIYEGKAKILYQGGSIAISSIFFNEFINMIMLYFAYKFLYLPFC